MSIIASVEESKRSTGCPRASTVKESTGHARYRGLIDASPFVALATSGPEGLDCSPRGDPPGFVRIHDEKTLMMPDRRGNNRVDSLRNIVRDPRVALLFLIPGVGTPCASTAARTSRIDPDLLASFGSRARRRVRSS